MEKVNIEIDITELDDLQGEDYVNKEDNLSLGKCIIISVIVSFLFFIWG